MKGDRSAEGDKSDPGRPSVRRLQGVGGIPGIPQLQPCHSDLHLRPLMTRVALCASGDPRRKRLAPSACCVRPRRGVGLPRLDEELLRLVHSGVFFFFFLAYRRLELNNAVMFIMILSYLTVSILIRKRLLSLRHLFILLAIKHTCISSANHLPNSKLDHGTRKRSTPTLGCPVPFLFFY